MSIRKVRELALDAVLPGHGPPFGDHRRVIDSLLGFQGRRQARLRGHVTAGPRTPWELTLELFPTSGPSDLFLTLSETVANLEAMAARGELVLLDDEEPWRYGARQSATS